MGVKCAQNGRQGRDGQIKATQDTFALLATFERYWAQLKVQRPKAVHVTLGGLIRPEAMTGDLFDPPAPARQEADQAKLCQVIDGLNQRFGQDTVRFGQLPLHRVPYTGAKIAFGRIPVAEDFRE